MSDRVNAAARRAVARAAAEYRKAMGRAIGPKGDDRVARARRELARANSELRLVCRLAISDPDDTVSDPAISDPDDTVSDPAISDPDDTDYH